jgi:uncharacterized protein YbaR (Trm112 family)
LFLNHAPEKGKKGNSYMAIKQELLDILACPKCKGDIYLNDSKTGLVCDSCKLLYEIRDDIPIMLIEEARPLG